MGGGFPESTSKVPKVGFSGSLTLCPSIVRRVLTIGKKPHVCNFSARNSGAGNGCANFMGAWHFLALSAGKPPMPIKVLVLGGGGFWNFFLKRGGESAKFIFMGVGIFRYKSATPANV